MDKSMLGDLNSLPPEEDKVQMSTMIDQSQIRDSELRRDIGWNKAVVEGKAHQVMQDAFDDGVEEEETVEEVESEDESNCQPGCAYVTNGQSDDVGRDVKKQLEDQIFLDNREKFVHTVRCQLQKEKSGIGDMQLCPRELLMQICFHRAVKCASALLEGQTGIVMDLNAPSLSGFYPLHRAAGKLSAGLVELFLQHGAQHNLLCDDDTLIFHQKNPLSVALDAIRNHQYFSDCNPKKSVIKLIYILCLPELREPLRSIQLLALNSKDEEIKVLCSHIVQDGRLVELAALLMVAMEKLTKPVTVSGVSVPMIEQCIIRQLQVVIDEEFSLMGCNSDGKLVRQCKHSKSVLLSASQMLKIFVKAGESLEKYRLSKRVEFIGRYMLVRDVAFLLKNLGFVMRQKDTNVDDLNCIFSKLGEKESVELSRAIEKERSTWSRLSTSAITDFNTGLSLSTSAQAMVHGRQAVYASSVRSFHCYHVSRNRASFKICDMEIQVNRTTLLQPLSLKFLLARKCASLAFCIGRGIRAI